MDLQFAIKCRAVLVGLFLLHLFTPLQNVLQKSEYFSPTRSTRYRMSQERPKLAMAFNTIKCLGRL